MVANALGVEAVDDVDAPTHSLDGLGRRSQAATIYELQFAFMAARTASLEAELERERERRRRVVQRYERLLAERDERIERLERRDEERSLLDRLRE